MGRALVVTVLAALPVLLPPTAAPATPAPTGPPPAAAATPAAPVAAQAPPSTSDEGNPIMLVVDTSGSMGDDDGTGRVKIEGARSALLNFVGGLPTSAVVGLRTYPGDAGSCSVGQLDFPPAARNPADVAARIRLLAPAGDTPTAEALEQAADDLRGGGYTTGTLILVSDGLHTCADPCPVAQDIAASGLALSVVTVGFQISDEGREELECIAEATDGLYVDADDNEALDQVLDDLTRPQLALTLAHPSRVTADVGLGQGSVSIEATVTNPGKVEAAAVQAQLRFDDIASAPGVVAPVRILGNLAAGSSTVVRWRFQAGLILVGKTIRFSVIVRGRDLVADLVKTGSVTVVGANGQEDAGPLLSDAERVVIMGDSYSAGEGAHEYLPGNDTASNPCHRSRRTYMVEAFSVADRDILACSGAVSLDVRSRSQHPHAAPQINQLATRQESGRPVDAVVLTIGGNDAGFADVARACLTGLQPCNEKVGDVGANQYLEQRLAGLSTNLILTYKRINDVLNSDDEVRERGSFAPILVLAYPRILPGAVQSSCFSMKAGPFELLKSSELAYIERLVSRLNGIIEGSVRSAATGRPGAAPLPVAFAPAVEDAFLPDHTVCDSERYANGLEDAQFYDELTEIALSFVGTLLGFIRSADFKRMIGDFTREVQELFHPNARGYAAMTRAIIRSSLDTAAVELAGRLDDPGAFASGDGRTRTAPVSGTVLQAGVSPIGVSAGTSYELRVEGMAPGLPALVTLESTSVTLASVVADAKGTVRTRVVMPEVIEPGAHHVVVYGANPAGAGVRQQIAVEVAPPGPALRQPVLFGGSLALALAGLILRRRGRRAANRPAPELSPLRA